MCVAYTLSASFSFLFMDIVDLRRVPAIHFLLVIFEFCKDFYLSLDFTIYLNNNNNNENRKYNFHVSLDIQYTVTADV